MWLPASSVLCFDQGVPPASVGVKCSTVTQWLIDWWNEKIELQSFVLFSQPYICCINHIEESNLTISKDGIDGMNGAGHCDTCTNEWHFSCECSLDVEIEFSHICPRRFFSSSFKCSSDVHGKRSILPLHPRSLCIFGDGTVSYSQWHSMVFLEKEFRCGSFLVFQFFQLKIFTSSRWPWDTCFRKQGCFLIPSGGTQWIVRWRQEKEVFHSHSHTCRPFHSNSVCSCFCFGTYRQSNVGSHTWKNKGGGRIGEKRQEHK